MRARGELIMIVAFVAVAGFLLGVPWLSRVFGPPTMGTGSYKHAKLWKEKLATCNCLDDVRRQFNCGRYQDLSGGAYKYVSDPNTFREDNSKALLVDLPNGDWLAMAYASSHGEWGGGTVVTRDSYGTIRVFFGHVCGRPFARGKSLEEVYASFRGPDWEEVSLGE